MNKILKTISLDLAAAAILIALVAEPSTRDFALTNLAVQLVLFLFLACIPAYRTKVMAVVDLAWPWGVLAIAVQLLIFGDAGSPLTLAVAAAYAVIGGRMGLWAAAMFLRHGLPKEDLPRYRYQRRRWRKKGYRGDTIPMQHEILQQAAGNISFLALPAMVIAARDGAGLGAIEIAALAAWLTCWCLESLADYQKTRFAAAVRGRTCNIGLWRYSRHPNYFFQWMQWNALIVAALPSFFELAGDLNTGVVVALAVGLPGLSYLMYQVLVYFTGALPAEYYSLQSRPDYADYQATTNRFFPGRVRST